MPRSFRFDHFTAQKPTVSRSLKNKDKQRVSATAQEPASGGEGLHYGKRYAETEELARHRAQSHAEAPGDATASPGQRPPPASAPEAQQASASEAAPELPRLDQAIDAGFVPAVPEPQIGQAPPAPSSGAAGARNVFDVLEEGREQVGVLARSAVELARAGLRLAQLSVELARLTAKITLRPFA